MAGFDHLVISAGVLGAGAVWVEERLGVPTEPGGQHDLMATHNRLLRLGEGEYLEVIAADPSRPAPARPRWFRLDRFTGAPRLTNWVVRCDDLNAALAVAPEGAGRATDLARGTLRWRMAVPGDGCLPYDDAFPGLIEWRGAHPAAMLPDRGCRLLSLTVSHPEAGTLARALPLEDPRVTVVAGPPGLSARIATPGGERQL